VVEDIKDTCVTVNRKTQTDRQTHTCEQDVGGEGVEHHQGGGQQGASVAPGEAHEGSGPLDGGEGGQVARGVEELRGGQGPQDHRSPGHTEVTWREREIYTQRERERERERERGREREEEKERQIYIERERGRDRDIERYRKIDREMDIEI